MAKTFFEHLTGAMGDAMALYGGARQTRISQQSAIGDTILHVERGSGLPEPGLVSVGRLTYSYDQAQPNRLTNIRALVGGAAVSGVLAVHPVGAGVVDVSASWSELDNLRSALFVGTATGEDLANLGRSLGVPRNEALADDDQYRAIIQALAYARRGTTQTLTALLDALLGKSRYELSEDPFGQPGKVIVTVPATALVSNNPLGKSYTANVEPGPPANDAFKIAAPAFGHGAIVMAPLSIQQATTTLRPSEAAPAGQWIWSGPNEKDDVKLLAESAAPTTVATLISINGAYQLSSPQLQEGREAQLELLTRVTRPSSLGAAGTLGAVLTCGGYTAAWIAQASGTATQVALADASYARLSPWVTLPAGYTAVGLVLAASGAQLLLNGQVAGAVRLAALTPASGGAAKFGNLSGQSQANSGATAPQLAIRSVSLSAIPGRDRWQGEGRNAVAQAPDVVSIAGAALAARHVGHRFILRGGTAARGRNNGVYRVAEVLSATQMRLQGESMADGQLDASGSQLTFLAPSAAFTFPDDVGKRLVVTGPGGSSTYTIASILEDITGRDLSTCLTMPLRVRGSRATLTGSANSASGLSWRLNPAMVAESSLAYVLSDAGSVSVAADGQTLLTYQPLPSSAVTYILPRRHVLGGIVRAKTSAFNRPYTLGPPIRLQINPLYAHAPLDALQAYLPTASASGIDVVLRS